jgi:hypothetical protein
MRTVCRKALQILVSARQPVEHGVEFALQRLDLGGLPRGTGAAWRSARSPVMASTGFVLMRCMRRINA